MKIKAWKCQETRSPLTIPQLRKACNLLSPTIVFLCETKNKKLFKEKLQKKLWFDDGVVVEAMHKSGGMTIMWKNEVTVLDVLTIAFTMEVHIMDTETNLDRCFIGIYSSTDA